MNLGEIPSMLLWRGADCSKLLGFMEKNSCRQSSALHGVGRNRSLQQWHFLTKKHCCILSLPSPPAQGSYVLFLLVGFHSPWSPGPSHPQVSNRDRHRPQAGSWTPHTCSSSDQGERRERKKQRYCVQNKVIVPLEFHVMKGKVMNPAIRSKGPSHASTISLCSQHWLIQFLSALRPQDTESAWIYINGYGRDAYCSCFQPPKKHMPQRPSSFFFSFLFFPNRILT